MPLWCFIVTSMYLLIVFTFKNVIYNIVLYCGTDGQRTTAADCTWGGEHAVQYIGDVLSNCTLETFVILLTNITSILI